MTRDQRITNATIGILLSISAIAVHLFVPAGNVWPWSLAFASVGIGLCVGAAAALDASNRAVRNLEAARAAGIRREAAADSAGSQADS